MRFYKHGFNKYTALVLFIMTMATPALSQQQSYDLFTFSPPSGWKKTTQKTTIAFSTTDNVRRTWAQITIVSSTTSLGSIEQDFHSEWKELIVKPYGAGTEPRATDARAHNEWKFKSGSGEFTFNKETANVTLNTFSDGQRCISFYMMSNTTSYKTLLDKFASTIQIQKPVGNSQSASAQTTTEKKPETPTVPSSEVHSDGFSFNTTNFQDGWSSVVREDWVEATKGNVRVLLHYPRKEDNEYISQQDEETRIFWNLLIARRYTNATEFFLYDYNAAYEPAHLASAYLIDGDGKKQFVTLFMKAKTGWIEIITPDRNTFVATFGVDRPDSYFGEWEALINLSGLNRFAVGVNDLKGKWSSDFSGSTQFYNSYTGMYAGYNAYQSNQNFTFSAGNTYRWKIVSATTSNGASNVQQDESAGTYSLPNNWQIYCSKIGKSPKTYDAYFKAVKGGRILNLSMTDYPGYTAYARVKD